LEGLRAAETDDVNGGRELLHHQAHGSSVALGILEVNLDGFPVNKSLFGEPHYESFAELIQAASAGELGEADLWQA
jgi:hypothetical protein